MGIQYTKFSDFFDRRSPVTPCFLKNRKSNIVADTEASTLHSDPDYISIIEVYMISAQVNMSTMDVRKLPINGQFVPCFRVAELKGIDRSPGAAKKFRKSENL